MQHTTLSEAALFHRSIKQSMMQGQLCVIETDHGYSAFGEDATLIGDVLGLPVESFTLEVTDINFPAILIGDQITPMIHLPRENMQEYFTALIKAGYLLAAADRVEKR